MVVPTLLYNFLLAPVLAGAVWSVKRRPHPLAALAWFVPGTAAAAFLAVLLGGDLFGMMRLFSWGVFLHGTALFGLFGILFWKKKRGFAIASGVLGLALLGVFVDAFLIEPTQLEISRVTVKTNKLEKPLRIVVLADLQTDEIGSHEKRALRAVMDQNPDLILMPGDFLQIEEEEERGRVRDDLRELLGEVRFGAPLGVFAVEGNVDSPDWPLIFEGFPVTVFEKARSITPGPVRITGLTLGESFNARLSRPEAKEFHVAFGHAPDFALGDVRADLLVAGHTHGGQVQLPGIGPLITLSAVPRAWASGVTELSGGRTLVVSRGVGMERGRAPRLRFLCPPEIVVIDVVPEE